MLKTRVSLLATLILSVCLTFSGTLSAGKPGYHGGGGVTVLAANGDLRFWDLAKAERVKLREFTNSVYKTFYLARGRSVPTIGVMQTDGSFFACAQSLLSRQQNPLLRVLGGLRMDLLTAKTMLPLTSAALGGNRFNFSDEYGFAHRIEPMPGAVLSTPTLDAKFQRPLGSFAAGVKTEKELFASPQDTLLISDPLYTVLSERDQCAFQVHEFLRYIGFTGSKSLSHLLTRPLTTEEIENFTARIVFGQPIHLHEIPATLYFRVLSKHTAEELEQMGTDRLNEIERIHKKPGEQPGLSLASLVMLRKMHQNSDKVVDLAKGAVVDIAKKDPSRVAADVVRKNQSALRSENVDVLEFFDEN